MCGDRRSLYVLCAGGGSEYPSLSTSVRESFLRDKPPPAVLRRLCTRGRKAFVVSLLFSMRTRFQNDMFGIAGMSELARGNRTQVYQQKPNNRTVSNNHIFWGFWLRNINRILLF